METKTEKAKSYLMDIIMSSPIGTKLPSERELLSHLGYSRPVVQNAINDLFSQGYIYKINRRGAYVAQNSLSNTINRLRSFAETAQYLNTVATTELLERAIITADDYLAQKMNVDLNSKIHYFLRLRKLADTPVVLEYDYFTDFSVANITKKYITDSIYKYIEQVRQLSIDSSTTIIDAVSPEPEIAAMLQLSDGEPLLQLNKISRLSDGRIFEHSISFVLSKYYNISVTSIR